MDMVEIAGSQYDQLKFARMAAFGDQLLLDLLSFSGKTGIDLYNTAPPFLR
jgi:hypothetical protein